MAVKPIIAGGYYQDSSLKPLISGFVRAGGIFRPLLDGFYNSVSSSAAPTFTVNPSIAPTTVAVGETVTVTPGTTDQATSRTYQWKRDAVAIGGATGLTYDAVSADVGKALTCTETASNANGSVNATSNATDPVTAPFVPTDIAGCKLWLDASQIVGLSDGDPVATWDDESGQANDATQATSGFRPTYETGVLNSKPVVRFVSASGQYLETTDIGISQPTTVFLVANQTTADGGRFFDGNSGGARQLIGLNSGTGFLQLFAGAGPINGSVDFSLAPHVFAVVFDGASSASWVDGAADISGNAGTNTLGVIFLGRDPSSNRLNGDIAEVIVYDSALGTTDRQTVEAYLATKYGL